MRGLSLVAASGGHSSSRCTGLSLSWPLLLQSTGSRRAGSVVVAHGPSCSVACGIFPDQGSNPCSLHYQADSQPLHHQGSPRTTFNSSQISLLVWLHSDSPRLPRTKMAVELDLFPPDLPQLTLHYSSQHPVLTLASTLLPDSDLQLNTCRPQARATTVTAPSPNHWITREFPSCVYFEMPEGQCHKVMY